MTVGTFGAVVFVVSESEIKTFRDMKTTETANIQTLARHGAKSATEWTGTTPKKKTFKMRLSARFCDDVAVEAKKLSDYLNSGTAERLVIGSENEGLFCVSQISQTDESFSKDGKLIQTELSVTLTEVVF